MPIGKTEIERRKLYRSHSSSLLPPFHAPTSHPPTPAKFNKHCWKNGKRWRNKISSHSRKPRFQPTIPEPPNPLCAEKRVPISTPTGRLRWHCLGGWLGGLVSNLLHTNDDDRWPELVLRPPTDCSRRAHKVAPLLVSGDDAHSTFSGYDRHRKHMRRVRLEPTSSDIVILQSRQLSERCASHTSVAELRWWS